jgi:hypothetical protein
LIFNGQYPAAHAPHQVFKMRRYGKMLSDSISKNAGIAMRR